MFFFIVDKNKTQREADKQQAIKKEALSKLSQTSKISETSQEADCTNERRQHTTIESKLINVKLNEHKFLLVQN